MRKRFMLPNDSNAIAPRALECAAVNRYDMVRMGAHTHRVLMVRHAEHLALARYHRETLAKAGKGWHAIEADAQKRVYIASLRSAPSLAV